MRNSSAIAMGLMLLFVSAISVQAQPPIQTSHFWQSAEYNWYGTGMMWRDANRDGFIDVFFSNGNDIVRARNTLYISVLGTLPSSASWLSSNPEYSGHCAVGDLTDNGFADFVVSNYLGPGGFGDPTRCNMYLNNSGQPSFAPDWYTGEWIFSFSCALGDADADGDLDLAVATGDAYNNIFTPDLIYYNDNGTLSNTAGWQSMVNSAAMDVTFGDLDKNGFLDLVVCSDNLGVTAFYNDASGLELSPSWQNQTAEPANTVITGDVNNDGWPDIIVAFNDQLGGGGYFRVYFNDGAGTINSTHGWQSQTGGYGSAVALYDYDNDGDDDLAAGRWWDRPRIYENIGGTFTTTPVWRADLATVVEELAWIDIDGDGLEQRADTIAQTGSYKLFYTTRRPLQAIDSVVADGNRLMDNEFCYDLIYGWVSAASAPSTDVVIYYGHSLKNDLTVVNWDTHAYAFANTNAAQVRFGADTTFGWAPLTVGFSDQSTGSSDQYWRFGDGAESYESLPVHTYTAGGSFDVYLENTLADGRHNHTERMMIITLADTLDIDDVVWLPSDTVKVPVYLTNSHPLHNIVLPITYSGPIQLGYVGFDTEGCRTDYFDQVVRTHSDLGNKRFVLKLTASTVNSNPPLAPGLGPIVNLYLSTTFQVGTCPIDTTSFSGQELGLEAYYLEYQPGATLGSVSVRRCGDINGDFGGPDVADLTALVDYLFRFGPAPDPLWIGNIDAEDDINVVDLSYLVDYLFRFGPYPICLN